MDLKLFTQAIFKFLGGLLIVGLLLFLPAGTFVWRQAWLLLGILFVPMFIAGLIMMKRAPDLLRKRLDAKEEEKEQKTLESQRPEDNHSHDKRRQGTTQVKAPCKIGQDGNDGH